MQYLSTSEWLLWGGVMVMSMAASLAVVSLVVFIVTGRKLRKKLEQEYGKPRH